MASNAVSDEFVHHSFVVQINPDPQQSPMAVDKSESLESTTKKAADKEREQSASKGHNPNTYQSVPKHSKSLAQHVAFVCKGDDAAKALLAGGYQVAIVTLLMFAICCLLVEPAKTTVENINCTLSAGNSSNCTSWIRSDSSYVWSPWTILKLMGSCLYVITGMANLKWLAACVEKQQLTPHMAYINSFMCWSAIIFGPLQVLTDVVAPALGYAWTLKFDYWYTLPNFGWALEWGCQLFRRDKKMEARAAASQKKGKKEQKEQKEQKQSRPTTNTLNESETKSSPTNTSQRGKITSYSLGARGLVIVLVSIASIVLDCRYLGGHMFPAFDVDCPAGSRHPGYDVAFISQAVPAIVMAVYCGCRFRSWKVFVSFILFLSGFLGFVLLQDLHHHVSPEVAESHWFDTAKAIGIKVCDNTQINFSIWFFIFMFQQKVIHDRVTSSGGSINVNAK